MTRSEDLIYAVDELPPWPRLIFLGAQHAALMSVCLVLIVIGFRSADASHAATLNALSLGNDDSGNIHGAPGPFGTARSGRGISHPCIFGDLHCSCRVRGAGFRMEARSGGQNAEIRLISGG